MGYISKFFSKFEENELITLILGFLFLIFLIINALFLSGNNKNKNTETEDKTIIPHFFMIKVSYICFFAGLSLTVMEDVFSDKSIWYRSLNFLEHLSFMACALSFMIWYLRTAFSKEPSGL